MVTKWIGEGQRLNSEIEIATSSSSQHSKEHSLNAMAWHLLAREKKFQIAQLKKYVTHVRILFTMTMITCCFSDPVYICSIICHIQIQSGKTKKKKWKSIFAYTLQLSFFFGRKFESLIVCAFYTIAYTHSHT